MTDIIDIIRAQQAGIPAGHVPPPNHEPEMLLIGCIDARLNIKSDIGIPDGKALIHRNIAALVRGKPSPDDKEGSSVAASVQFAINIMRVKHIVVMGHTDCGGIRACLDGNHTHDTDHIRHYLAGLDPTREAVIAQGGNTQAQARAMEEAAVRQSVANLHTYDVVEQALADGRVDLHGWVIDTGTRRICEMDLQTGRFQPMGA